MSSTSELASRRVRHIYKCFHNLSFHRCRSAAWCAPSRAPRCHPHAAHARRHYVQVRTNRRATPPRVSGPWFTVQDAHRGRLVDVDSAAPTRATRRTALPRAIRSTFRHECLCFAPPFAQCRGVSSAGVAPRDEVPSQLLVPRLPVTMVEVAASSARVLSSSRGGGLVRLRRTSRVNSVGQG